MAKLTNKQEMFCREYIVDFNATQASIRAGYSENAANRIGCENMTKPDIQKKIAALIEERKNRVEIDADYVLQRLVEIDQMDVLDILNDDLTMKPIAKWPLSWRRTIQGIDLVNMASNDNLDVVIKKIKWPDKVRNLELLGKHVNVQAYKENISAKHESGINVMLIPTSER